MVGIYLWVGEITTRGTEEDKMYKPIDVHDKGFQDLVSSIVKNFYYDPRYSRLRNIYCADDFLQEVWLKLLHRDNYKKFRGKYRVTTFIFILCRSVAFNTMKKKSSGEVPVLDAKNDEGLSMADLLVDLSEVKDRDEVKARLRRIMISLPEVGSDRLSIVCDDGEVPFTVESLFALYLRTKETRSELRRRVFNKNTGAVVSGTTFNRFFKMIESCIYQDLEAYAV